MSTLKPMSREMQRSDVILFRVHRPPLLDECKEKECGPLTEKISIEFLDIRHYLKSPPNFAVVQTIFSIYYPLLRAHQQHQILYKLILLNFCIITWTIFSGMSEWMFPVLLIVRKLSLKNVFQLGVVDDPRCSVLKEEDAVLVRAGFPKIQLNGWLYIVVKIQTNISGIHTK